MKEKIATVSVIVNVVLFLGKVIVGFLTNSTAVLAEGIDSGTDILSSLISRFGIEVAKKPVDKEHPYGHYKFEVLSGLFITIILFFTGVSIIYKAYQNLMNPTTIYVGYLSLGVMAVTAIINEIMARLKIKYGKKENSVSLISDGLHSRIDVWRSVAVFFGLILANYYSQADQIIAGIVGLYIIKESFRLGKQATDSLLDISADQEDEDKIKKIIKSRNVQLVDLKTQKKGSIITADVRVRLDPDIKVQEATQIINDLERELIDKVGQLEFVSIQIDSKEIDVASSYFKSKEPILRGLKGFGWKRKKEGEGKGPKGLCVCPNCDYKQEHKRGTPCPKIKCPECDTPLKRE